MNVGCLIGQKLVNHLMYADDIVLIAPSSAGMQKLLNTCCSFGVSHDVVYNCSKSVTMSCKSKEMNHLKVPTFMLGSVPLECVKKVVRYLGHINAEDMTDDADIANQNKCLFVRGNMLLGHFTCVL